MSSTILLKIFVQDAVLLEKYKTAIAAHNKKQAETAPYVDSGFDLFVPDKTGVSAGETVFLDHRIKCAMTVDGVPAGFYLYPRSSISKTPLILANSVGIIDAGYRGNIIGAFRHVEKTDWIVQPGTRLLQICHPSLKPIQVKLVASEMELSGSTSRGAGGFGSTS